MVSSHGSHRNQQLPQHLEATAAIRQRHREGDDSRDAIHDVRPVASGLSNGVDVLAPPAAALVVTLERDDVR